VSQKNDTDVAHCNFSAHQPILVIFGRDVTERIYYTELVDECRRYEYMASQSNVVFKTHRAWL